MAAIIHCDTHAALWLYAGEMERFGKKAIEAIETHDLVISPIVRLEMRYLLEIERISEKPELIIKVLSADFGMRICDRSFASVAETAEGLHWTRDPFDRLIVAQAIVAHAPLITKDDVIRKHYKQCIW